ncbi:hypothetical protein CKA55_07380 [Arcobacter suis]|uniref:Uncharacterized protein n=1 Tax=Arcobacter suis CECT 7833 TaxID=663365 RepID=A0AAD0SQ25_9BACT|nr:hypothetical protein [Arcobacter suis]AXX89317.1 hypothetical protein ASUIS_0826 [Arcobacter suis CECT 7833]RWS46551.1 hypothetical protein CKA55_07380 [Arcobacter suis]
MKADKNLLKKEKELLGNNLPEIAQSWNSYLGLKLTPKDVAMMLSFKEEIKVKVIQDRLNDLKEKTGFLINNDLQEVYNTYKIYKNLSDRDKKNYLFIATNYDEYLSL